MNCTYPFGEFNYNSTCHFSCTEGFDLYGSDKLEYGASGNWTAEHPMCEVHTSDRMWELHKSIGAIIGPSLVFLLLSFLVCAIIRHHGKAKQEHFLITRNDEKMETTPV
ncbi:E-selectin-like [Chiloscyllium plagiosum]|uniref:E-selectin-like n=1 Tax=Chiloscyllium plagiosum TaxID=36176 RepID=UPI001CB7B52B|nr:E-selectin-like [Chiloscyllium plagiosum]XP_043555529.1 E-selectin-like [Chiloscyllium plagiosum]